MDLIPRAKTDATRILKEDHRRVEDLLTQLTEDTDTAPKRRSLVYQQLRALLKAHEVIEQRVFYPAVDAVPDGHEIIQESLQEHHVVDLLIAELDRMPKSHEDWCYKAIVLKESIAHHVKEEEHSMFPLAQKRMSRDKLQQLGERMLKIKREMLEREWSASARAPSRSAAQRNSSNQGGTRGTSPKHRSQSRGASTTARAGRPARRSRKASR